MKIDWKEVAASPGYISLKEACIKDILKKHRNKEDLFKKFNWVICRAKHYAHTMGVSITTILNKWEAERKYWWLNYYKDYNQPKFGTKSTTIKPMGINGFRKSMKYPSSTAGKQDRKNRVCWFIKQRNKSKKVENKAHWSKRRKEVGMRRRARLQEVCKSIA